MVVYEGEKACEKVRTKEEPQGGSSKYVANILAQKSKEENTVNETDSLGQKQLEDKVRAERKRRHGDRLRLEEKVQQSNRLV